MERGMTAQHSQEKDGSPEMSARVELSHCAELQQVLPALLFDVWAVLVLMTPKPPKGTSWRWQGGRSWAERPQRAGSSAG